MAFVAGTVGKAAAGKAAGSAATKAAGSAAASGAAGAGAGAAAAAPAPAAAPAAAPSKKSGGGTAGALSGAISSGSRDQRGTPGFYRKATAAANPTAVANAGGGLVLGAISYVLVLTYLRSGSAGVKAWARAKFLNQTSTSGGTA